MKILIIGGCGFVGSNLARYFSKTATNEVYILDNLVRRGSELNLAELNLNNPGIKYYHGDIRNKEDITVLDLINPDIILNCAAQPAATNYLNPEFDITNNTIGQMNLLEYCKNTGTPIILWSTNKVYPADHTNFPDITFEDDGKLYWAPSKRPYFDSEKGFNEGTPISGRQHSIYGVSKAMADLATQEYSDAFGFPAIINRFSCLSGPNQWGKAEQGWVAWFCIANHFGLPLTLFGYNGAQVRDCLFTDDINNLIHKQVDELTKGRWNTCEVYNVGGGAENTLSLREAIAMIEDISGTKWPEKPVMSKVRRADQAIYISDITKVCEDFNWTPTLSVREGLEQIIEWVQLNEDTLSALYGSPVQRPVI